MSKSKKILLYTVAYTPDREAVSKEVEMLKNHFKDSFLVCRNSKASTQLSLKERTLIANYRLYRLGNRALSFIEGKFDLTHIYREFMSLEFISHFKKPLVVTEAEWGAAIDARCIDRVSVVIVESESVKAKFLEAGFNERKVRLVYPGIDLTKFSYKKAEGPFKILFASSPANKDFFGPRGIDVMLESAENVADTSFLLKWRGNPDRPTESAKLIKSRLSDLELPNVILDIGIFSHINSVLGNVHATIAPFTSVEKTKPCPNSILESLAAGKPVLVTNIVGISDLIERERCGVVCEPDSTDITRGINELKDNYAFYQENSRRCAEKYFSQEKFLHEYDAIYSEVLGTS